MSLSGVKAAVVAASKAAVIHSPLSIDFQKRMIDQALPLDGAWSRSLAYQQCLANRVLKRYGNSVQTGPFKGLRYLRDADEGCIVPKLLGSYEEELAPTLGAVVTAAYRRIIDVGCASGYFVAGFAFRMRDAAVFGFDIDPQALGRCAHLLRINQLGAAVTLGRRRTHADLRSLIEPATLLLMDIDGGEFELLRPDLVPELATCDMIIETHDCFDARITSTLRDRFQHSHEIEVILSAPRTATKERYPGLDALPTAHWPAALDERRPPSNNWMIFRPKGATRLSKVS